MSNKPKRTKEQKMQAQVKRAQTLSYSYQGPSFSAVHAVQEKPEEKNEVSDVVTHEIFGYDVHVVYKDLMKTILITVGIIGLLLGIYFFGGRHF